jgi:phage tail sheath protein FI
MPEYLAPGVFVEETSFRSKSIEGVSTSTTAFVGPTRKGPLSGKLNPSDPAPITPEVITSFGEFQRVYGGLADLSLSGGPSTNYIAHAAKAFFDNGGSRLYVARTFLTGSASGVATSDAIVVGSSSTSPALTARFIARMPGAGLNGKVHAYLKTTQASGVMLQKAPQGSLLRTTGGAGVAQAAKLDGGKGPFVIPNGGKLVLALESGPNKEITFSGEQAKLVGHAVADPAVVTLPAADADRVLTVAITGRVPQAIQLPAGPATLKDIALAINGNLTGGWAGIDAVGDKLVIGSDSRGSAMWVTASGATGLIVGALQLSSTSLATSATSPAVTGTIGNLNAVSEAEIDSLLQTANAGIRASKSPTTQQLLLTTDEVGAAAQLHIVNGTGGTTPAVKAALGFLLDDGAPGAAGETHTYYRYASTSWVDESGVSAAPIDSAELLTLTIVAEDGDGNQLIFDDLGFGANHPRFVGEVLKQYPSRKSDAMVNPVYLSIDSGALAHQNLPFILRSALFGLTEENMFDVKNGNDGAVPDSTATEAGLLMLQSIEDISIIAAPGHSEYGNNFQPIQLSLITHCEKMKYRIVVLDVPSGSTPGEARTVRSRIDSTRAALYYPFIIVSNPLARPGNSLIPKEIALPPSGFVTGIYARTDVQRGVWKAPANEVVMNALRFERDITFGEQETLNPEGINCLRSFSGRGNRLWGARTASSDPEWKYVNVRRYFIYLERSIDRSTQWAVFEPNGDKLWANIRETVSSFLYSEWHNGALLGTKPEMAYFVRCDRSTMTQNDLDNGRLVCEIGVAALYPAEFVIFRIGQKTADSRQ